MYNLSLSQQFLMFAVNKQGKISSLDTRTWVCCVTSAVIDLHLNDCVSISDDKRPTVSTTAELPSTLHHLLPIYQRISEKGPIKLNKLVEQYMMGRSGPRTQLFDSLGNSLVAAGAATPQVSGILKRSTGYVPDSHNLDRLRSAISAETSSTDAPTRNTVILATLLERSKLLKEYFSRDERARIKDMVKKHADSQADTLIKKTSAHIDAHPAHHLSISVCIAGLIRATNQGALPYPALIGSPGASVMGEFPVRRYSTTALSTASLPIPTCPWRKLFTVISWLFMRCCIFVKLP